MGAEKLSRTHHRKKANRRSGSKLVDRSCRNHGSCGYCQGGRSFKTRQATVSAREQERALTRDQ